MMTKIEVTKTYWIGITAEQKNDLLTGILLIIDDKMLMPEQREAINALRLALLNV